MSVVAWYISLTTLPITCAEMMSGSSESFSSERATFARSLLRPMGMVSTGLDAVGAELRDAIDQSMGIGP